MGLPKTLTGIICSVLLYGCSLNPVTPDRHDHDAMQLIATDLVNALVQLSSIPVRTTTLNLPHGQLDGSSFGSALQERFERVGYAVRTVGSNPADKAVSYMIDQKETGSDGKVAGTFTVTIGSVSVRRNYANLDTDEVYPTAAMLVMGTDASDLRVSDSIFKHQGSINELAQLPTESPADMSAQMPVKESAEVSADMTQRTFVIEAPVIQLDGGLQAETLSRLQTRPLQNFRELKRSNFSDLYQSLAIVRETILQFANDSIELGSAAREQIAQFVDVYDIQRDVFSVIGCSNGATSAAAGPKSLALGRAADVTAVLMSLGVPRQSVLEEGCWSGEHFDEMMPRRGVVLSLQRYPTS